MSWLSSLRSVLGDAANDVWGVAQTVGSRALDEASLLASGAVEETRDPLNQDRFNRPPRRKIESLGVGPWENPTEGAAYSDELMNNFASAITAPLRAVDRASHYYTGDTLGLGFEPSDFEHKRNIAGPKNEAKGSRGQANRSSPEDQVDAVGELARLKAEDEASTQEDAARIPELRRLMELKSQSKAADSDVFTARGNNVLRGAVPEGETAYVGDRFSKSQRPVVEQAQIRTLGQMGIPAQAAEALIDNGGQGGARRAIMELTSRSLVSKQDQVAQALQSYQQNVAKADNKDAVLAALVMQLRNVGLSDSAIQMMLMSVGGNQPR